MKTAIITDSSAYLSDDIRNKNNVFVLDVPVFIAGETYIEGKNLTVQAFYDKMAVTEELPKTSQPSISDLVTLLEKLQADGYTQRPNRSSTSGARSTARTGSAGGPRATPTTGTGAALAGTTADNR